MGNQVTFTPLDRTHKRREFDCGDKVLNAYFWEQALQDQKANATVCHVMAYEGAATQVIGYVTVSMAQVDYSTIPMHLRGKLRRYDQTPALLIGRLAVDKRYARQGFGGLLVAQALNIACDISSMAGVSAVVVDPMNEGLVGYYAGLGFQRLEDDTLRMFQPLAPILQERRKATSQA